MNNKEVLEIKKQQTPATCNIQRIAGCYVNAEKEIVSTMVKPIFSLPEESLFRYFDIFRKGLSGKIGKTLLNTEYQYGPKNEKQEALLALRSSQLKDEELLERFYESVVENYQCSENYFILVAYGVYDIPGASSSAESQNGLNDDDLGYASDHVFEYIQCCICPVSLEKNFLIYDKEKADLECNSRDWIIGMPDKGFLYPSFSNRRENIHQLLYYTKKSDDMQEGILSDMLGVSYLPSAGTQQRAFATAVETADLTLHEVFGIKKQIGDHMEENMYEPSEMQTLNLNELTNLSGLEQSDKQADLKNALEAQGVKALLPQNLFQQGKTKIKTTNLELTIKNNQEHLVEMRNIDGVNCIVLMPDGEITVDEIPVRMFREN